MDSPMEKKPLLDGSSIRYNFESVSQTVRQELFETPSMDFAELTSGVLNTADMDKLKLELEELCQALVILSRKPVLDITDPSIQAVVDNDVLPEPVVSTSVFPPDGGWGWVIVGSAFYINFMLAGLFRSYGVLLSEITVEFPLTSTALAAWIPSVLGTLSLVLSPGSSFLCDRLGCRPVVFVGGLLTAVGTALCYFLCSVPYLILTGGVITGVGFTLCITPCLLIVGLYFEKHRALANSLSSSGSALGGLVMPHIMRTSLEAFNLKGTFLLLGGLMLTICLAACLLTPLQTRKEKPRQEIFKGSCLTSAYRALSLDLMTNPVFMVLATTVIFMSAGSPHVLFFLPAYAESAAGLSKYNAGSLLSYTAFGDLSGRVVLGWASDKKFLPRRVEYVCSITLAALVVLALPSLNDLASLATFSILYGIATGSWQCLIPVMLADYHGAAKLGGTLSLIRMLQGFNNLAVPPISGYLHDTHGHYLAGFYLMGGLMAVSAVVALTMPLAESLDRRKILRSSFTNLV